MTSGPPPGHRDEYPPPSGEQGDEQPAQAHPAGQYPGQYPGQFPAGQYPGQYPAGQPAGPGAWGAAQFRPVHRPGAIALRPLTLGDLYDGAVRIVRHNLAATVGAALVVGLIGGFLPLLLTEVVRVGRGFSQLTGDPVLAADLGELAASSLGTVVSAILGTLVTGMIVMVCRAAAVGRALTFSQAWAATAGSRLRLIGLTVLASVATLLVLAPFLALVAYGLLADATTQNWGAVLIGLLVVLPVSVVLLVFVWVRLYLLAPPALVMERLGIFASLRRAWQLSRGQFWRLLGISLLTSMLVGLVATVITIPLGLVAGALIFSVGGSLWFGLATALSTVLASAVTTPFASTVTNLQYLDQRIRKEAYDVDLAEDAGIRRG